MPDHLTCLLRNLYAGQEATVRTGHGTTDWFQIGKGVRPCIHLYMLAHNILPPASKVILKILQARLQQYVNSELAYVQAAFRNC